MISTQMEICAPDSTVPDGSTPSWFTNKGWWLDLERRLLEAKLIPRRFNLDPCAHHEAPVSKEIWGRPGGRMFTAEQDGLAQRWDGYTVWSNPPYDSETLEKWCPAYVERAGACHGLVVHVPSWTDGGWWQDWIEPRRRTGAITVWFERGRMRYGWPGNPTGQGGDTAKFPSAILIWPCSTHAD